MKFEFVRKVQGKVPTYGGHVVQTGDVIELDGHLAKKAAANPDYQAVREERQTAEDLAATLVATIEASTLKTSEELSTALAAIKSETAKRRGRPPKVKNGDEG